MSVFQDKVAIITGAASGIGRALTEALAVGAELICVPRSGNADDPVDSETPETQPVSPFNSVLGEVSGGGPLTLVETISGPKRKFEAVPRSD